MKKLITILAITLSINVSAQWVNKTIDNGFDTPFKKAYVNDADNNCLLILEEGLVEPFMAIVGLFYCDDIAIVDFVFTVNGNKQHFTVNAYKSDDDVYYFKESIWTAEFKQAFISSTTLKVRINQEYCGSDMYSFNMSKSTAAYNFIVK
jgi:hypothetical protein